MTRALAVYSSFGLLAEIVLVQPTVELADPVERPRLLAVGLATLEPLVDGWMTYTAEQLRYFREMGRIGGLTSSRRMTKAQLKKRASDAAKAPEAKRKQKREEQS